MFSQYSIIAFQIENFNSSSQNCKLFFEYILLNHLRRFFIFLNAIQLINCIIFNDKQLVSLVNEFYIIKL